MDAVTRAQAKILGHNFVTPFAGGRNNDNAPPKLLRTLPTCITLLLLLYCTVPYCPRLLRPETQNQNLLLYSSRHLRGTNSHSTRRLAFKLRVVDKMWAWGLISMGLYTSYRLDFRATLDIFYDVTYRVTTFACTCSVCIYTRYILGLVQTMLPLSTTWLHVLICTAINGGWFWQYTTCTS